MFQEGCCCRGVPQLPTTENLSWQVQCQNAISIADCHQVMRDIDMDRLS